METKLDRSAVVDTLASRITKDIGEALDHIDEHEVIGILEMIKISLTTQVLNHTAKLISDAIKGDSIEH